MNKYYGYEDFNKDSKILLEKVKPYNPDTLLIIARGGLTLGHVLSLGLNLRQVYTINSVYYEKDKALDKSKVFNIPNLSKSKKVLIVDDIIDSGETIENVHQTIQSMYKECDFKIATLFYKTTATMAPDFFIREANEWIDFFWEVDILAK